jgi:hypothetical protein
MPVLTGLHAVSPAARWSKSMPVEFLHGRPLTPDDLELIRQQIEYGFDNITRIDLEIRDIVARNGLTCFQSYQRKRSEIIQG